MFNNRPLNNPHIQQALEAFHDLCLRYDLVGGVTFADAQEMGYAYHLPSTWNGFVADETTPLGFRIRIQEATLGQERAQAAAEGTLWTCAALRDFGKQTLVWGRDLVRLLRSTGMQIHAPERAVPRLDTLR